ncbi:MAG: hypothetical protein HQL98_08525 [Magnetococcales bacterium]|nr:hypothetical protein [Magnetococcales bacterium]
MKKSILLGAAALAAIALSAPQAADAGELKIGGYYQFRAASMDNTPSDAIGEETANYWAQRLQLNLDMKASDKSHAHAIVRALDSSHVDGADSTVTAADAQAEWVIRQMWLETEAWGVGLKVGSMPIALNDGILVNHDVTSYGSILLSKNFGGVTVVGANVKVNEGDPTMTVGPAGGNHKDVDLWVLSALGKFNTVDYQVTGAFMNEESGFVGAGAAPIYGIVGNGTGLKLNGGDNVSDGWLALTLGTNIQGIDVTGTAIYETGMDNVTAGSQLENDGFMFGVRAKGKTGFGGWNAYAMYGSEDFTAVVPGGDMTFWSPTWDMGGPGSVDLMKSALTGVNNNSVATSQSNIWGLGAGLSINAGAWTIKPSLDYAQIVEERVSSNTLVGPVFVKYDSAWGGTLAFSTKIQEGTTLDLSGSWVDPNSSNLVAGTTEDTLHYLQASVKMDF